MTATFCLGGFAQRINRLPKEQWKSEVEKMPEACLKGCVTNCREVCAEYARMQWKMLTHKEQEKSRQRKANRGGKDKAAGE